jgi:hypothetical protein
VFKVTIGDIRNSFMVLALIILLIGCAAPPSAQMLVPVTGTQLEHSGFKINEYPLIEQSADNPTHAGFQDRVPRAVKTIRGSWNFPLPENAVQAPNKILTAFGYELKTNPSPPFSGYALYQGGIEIQRDIAHFWPVSLKQAGSAQVEDFLLAFETMTGERLIASTSGISPWPGQESVTSGTPPVFYQGEIAYAHTSGDMVSVIAGSDVLYAGMNSSGALPRGLVAWHQPTGETHWALEIGGRVILDGQDFNQSAGYEEVFYWQVINGQPFYFFIRDGRTYLNFAGVTQPFFYDMVVSNGLGEASIYNPGSNERMVWFYALRDGLWYYVEAGLLE